MNINCNYNIYPNNSKYLNNSSIVCKKYETQTLPSFTGMNIYASSEKGFQKIEYSLRIIVNKIADFFESKKTKMITKNIAQITPEPGEKYLAQLEEISRFFSTKKTIDVNTEDKILEKIAQKNDSLIFIMNHSNQSKDPSMLAVLNTLLVRAYKSAGKVNNFPLPKIILNQDILKAMNPTKRRAFENFGAVGIDANIYSGDKNVNARAFLPLIKDFVRNKSNIFIFPEGKLSVRRDLDLNARFQIGIAELINKVLGVKKNVSVVPVGFAYGKGVNKTLTGMHIGEPIIFSREGENTTTTCGNILKSKFATEEFKKFFEKHKDKAEVQITNEGIPVKKDEISEYIKNILSENLEICSKEAEKRIERPIDINEVIEV